MDFFYFLKYKRKVLNNERNINYYGISNRRVLPMIYKKRQHLFIDTVLSIFVYRFL